jgi:hypothetical protein
VFAFRGRRLAWEELAIGRPVAASGFRRLSRPWASTDLCQAIFEAAVLGR